MESYQAANVIFVAIILWTAIKNSGKTIPEKMIWGSLSTLVILGIS